MKKSLQILIISALFLPVFSFASDKQALSLPSSTSTDEDSAIVSSSSVPVIKSFTTCSQEAIEKRDSSIGESRSVYNSAMNAALLERKNKEKAAVAIKKIDDKKDAIKLSVDTYKKEVKAAQNTLTQARKEAWQSFEDDIKTCHDIEKSEITSDTQVSSLQGDGEESDALGKKRDGAEPKETKSDDSKSFRESLKAQFENLKSLFN